MSRREKGAGGREEGGKMVNFANNCLWINVFAICCASLISALDPLIPENGIAIDQSEMNIRGLVEWSNVCVRGL